MRRCPDCGENGKVVDSRNTSTGVRRRRECDNGDRWTTYEVDDSVVAYLRTRETLETMGRALLELSGVEEGSMQCPECDEGQALIDQWDRDLPHRTNSGQSA